MRGSLVRNLLIVLSATALSGQTWVGGDADWKGLSIKFVVGAEPPARAPIEFSEAVIGQGVGGVDAVRRLIDDPVHKRSFGYELRLEPSADGRTAQIRIGPLRDPRHAVRNGWTAFGLPAGLAKYPVIPNLGVGDTVAIDLLINPATGQKIVDYLTLEGERGGPAKEHDFSLADVRLTLDRPRVWMGGPPLGWTKGKLLESTVNFQGRTSGNMVWIYLADHGRYLLSLFPNQKAGFQKNGQATRNTFTFRDGERDFYIECGGPVAPGEGPYNLYVQRDSAWLPRKTSDLVEIGSAPDAASVTGNR
jgi:hypothetical protein